MLHSRHVPRLPLEPLLASPASQTMSEARKLATGTAFSPPPQALSPPVPHGLSALGLTGVAGGGHWATHPVLICVQYMLVANRFCVDVSVLSCSKGLGPVVMSA